MQDKFTLVKNNFGHSKMDQFSGVTNFAAGKLKNQTKERSANEVTFLLAITFF